MKEGNLLINRGSIAMGLLLLVAVASLPSCKRGSNLSTTGAAPAGALIATPTPEPLMQMVTLLIPGSDGMLHPKLRELALPTDSVERVRALVGEVLRTSPLSNNETSLNAVFIKGKTAYLDLAMKTDKDTHIGGSTTELMFVYSIVNTVLLNCPELRRVQLLVNGSEIPTLYGHLDLSKPLEANKGVIAGM